MDTKDKKYFDDMAAKLAAETRRSAKAATAAVVAADAAAIKAAHDSIDKKLSNQDKEIGELKKGQKNIAKVQSDHGKKLDDLKDGQDKINGRLDDIEEQGKVNALPLAVGMIVGAIIGILIVALLMQPEGAEAVVAYIAIPLLCMLAVGWGLEGFPKPKRRSS